MAKVLLISLDVIGKSMAGPGIRYYEFAKAISPYHEVTLLTPNEPDIQPEGFRFAPRRNLRKEIKNSDIVVVQELNLQMALFTLLYHKKVIIDAYDPQPLEHLEIFKKDPLNARRKRNRYIIKKTAFSLKRADGILAANQLQKDLWIGFLMGLGKITPEKYDEDPSLELFIGKAPFGLPDTPLNRSVKGMREKFGIKPDDFVLLWGGGIWNWFDPLTLIKAVRELNDPQVKLVFMGLKHPNEGVLEMKMSLDAVKLAEDLQVKDSQVFFNFGWTPYQERQMFLAESDVGVSTHLKHLETRYSFRTRILDYLWAGLPLLLTEGDSFATQAEKEKCGLVVPYENVDALRDAIKVLKENKQLVQEFKQNSENLSREYIWPKATSNLKKMIDHLSRKEKIVPFFNSLFDIVFTFKKEIAKYPYLKLSRILKRG